MAVNVLGGELLACSFDPLTGYTRDGCCQSDPQDRGAHWICARMTSEFLDHSFSVGNDLTTPRPQWRFAGLRPGDRWCVCAHRWLDALEEGVAPPVILQATNEAALKVVPLEVLQAHAWPTSQEGRDASR